MKFIFTGMSIIPIRGNFSPDEFPDVMNILENETLFPNGISENNSTFKHLYIHVCLELLIILYKYFEYPIILYHFHAHSSDIVNLKY